MASLTDDGILSLIYSLFAIIPGVAVMVRRLHDTDRTGWWLLAPIAIAILGVVVSDIGGASVVFPIATFILIMVLLAWFGMAGTAGPNRFGEDPTGQYTDAEEVFG